MESEIVQIFILFPAKKWVYEKVKIKVLLL
jgi:hypothetical protein